MTYTQMTVLVIRASQMICTGVLVYPEPHRHCTLVVSMTMNEVHMCATYAHTCESPHHLTHVR